MILKGRYELLWIAGVLTLLAYVIADRLTITGLGKGFASNLGLNYKLVFSLGIIIVACISGIVVVIAGVLPFIGLVVPNITSLLIGDNLRHTMPVIACFGAIMTLICDIIARLLIFPYEVPVGVIMGVIGSLIFLALLNRRPQHD
jgi:iron complex transport system permease protein